MSSWGTQTLKGCDEAELRETVVKVDVQRCPRPWLKRLPQMVATSQGTQRSPEESFPLLSAIRGTVV